MQHSGHAGSFAGPYSYGVLRCVKASGSLQLQLQLQLLLLPSQGLPLAPKSRGPVDQNAALGRVSRQMIPRCDRRFGATPLDGSTVIHPLPQSVAPQLMAMAGQVTASLAKTQDVRASVDLQPLRHFAQGPAWLAFKR